MVLPELLASIFTSNTLKNYNTGQRYATNSVPSYLLFFPPGCSSWNLVKSYTSWSTMIHRLSALLCDATSLIENDLDMMCVVVGKKVDVEEDGEGIGKRRRKTRRY